MEKIDTIITILYNIQQLIENLYQRIIAEQSPAVCTEELMTRQQVKDYLGISETTYKRKVEDGTLKPLQMPGGHRYYKSQLIEAFLESRRRGRV